MTPRVLPPGVSGPAAALRVLLLVLPCAALALALPDVPHPALWLLTVASAAWWAHTPDHPTGAVTLLLVTGWWTVHGVLDGRVLVVGVLLVAAHVAATVAAHGPATWVPDRGLVALWVRRGLLALVPMPITYLAVRGLDADLAPAWLWTVAALATAAALLVTARLTQPVSP